LPDPFGSRVERLKGDRTTPDFARLLKGRAFDAVVDFAAYAGSDVASVIESLGARAGHYVFISTGQVYLVREQCPRPSREVDYPGPLMAMPPDPGELREWEYGVGKRAGEDLLEKASHQLPSTRLRIPMVNGERDYYRRVEGYLWRILDGGPVIVPDGGRHQTRHVYGMDVAQTIVSILGKPATFGRAYNLCQIDTPTLGQLLVTLTESLGAPVRLVNVAWAQIQDAGLDPVAISPFSGHWMSMLDPARACRELAFQPQAPAAYLPRIVSSFLAQPPNQPPDGYRRRQAELDLAQRHGAPI
jgi:nucleoside-diphosphate-sugar epimerase